MDEFIGFFAGIFIGLVGGSTAALIGGATLLFFAPLIISLTFAIGLWALTNSLGEFAGGATVGISLVLLFVDLPILAILNYILRVLALIG